MTPSWSKLLFSCLVMFLVSVATPVLADSSDPPVSNVIEPLSSFANWGKLGQGNLVTDVAVDPSGNIWVSTEDTGIWMCHPASNTNFKWIQFYTKSGLPDDDCSALLCTKNGQVWCGTLSHGVYVYNGESWKNYDALNGPLGYRIFAIAECPTDGNIWISTENGLSEYLELTKTWRYFTTRDGLPSNQISALAFDQAGTLYAGSQCNGLAIGSPTDNYQSWRIVSGPLYPPHKSNGEGMPSQLINAVKVMTDGSIYVGTDSGLARSGDGGKSWLYTRGKDWAAIAAGEYMKPEQNPTPGAEIPADEDYVTSLGEDAAGYLWAGHRTTGLEMRTTKPSGHVATFGNPDQQSKSAATADYITSVCWTQEGMLVGTYGYGLETVGFRSVGDQVQQTKSQNSPISTTFPAEAVPPTVAELSQVATDIESSSPKITPGQAYYLGEGWTTKGNWVGHYGRQYAILCADRAPLDHEYLADTRYTVNAAIGPNHPMGDSMRYWVAEVKTDNPNSLYDPIAGYRRQAEWDDHGEADATTAEGADLWLTVTVPEGVHRFSLYFFNNDGNGYSNRDRDYLIEVRSYTAAYADIMSKPPLAVARVVNFRGGVYKSFVLCGPTQYAVRINRNHSFNTMLSSVMIDRLLGPVSQWESGSLPWMGGMSYSPPDPRILTDTDEHLLDKILAGKGTIAIQNQKEAIAAAAPAEGVMDILNELYDHPTAYSIEESTRLLLYRPWYWRMYAGFLTYGLKPTAQLLNQQWRRLASNYYTTIRR